MSYGSIISGAAIDAASAGFPASAATSPRERGEILRAAFERMPDRRDELARLIAAENGKTLRDALGEVDCAPSSSGGTPRRPFALAASSGRRPAATSRSRRCASRSAPPC